MDTRYSADPVRYLRMTTQELRDTFLLQNLFIPGSLCTVYSEIDRVVIGGAIPTKKTIELSSADELRADYFCQRRELGVINIGECGTIEVDGTVYKMDNLDALYIGQGSKAIQLTSNNPDNPACYYLLSYPAHKSFPTKQAKKAEAEAVHLGSDAESNKRTIYKYIHPAGIQSCQLVMGFTELAEGNIWNTMPPHTHARRMEVYLYFNIPGDHVVFHLMGPPDETRHLVVRDRQAVISPSWSLHSGAGTARYSFIWGMGGENQAFDDMDGIEMKMMK
ncbi:5-dehydro-4-deoxy-D-glucuronate isomerase [bacterium]|nr:5-dehydro-4-deoxy-D-glucuronate isomerase [bacterium]